MKFSQAHMRPGRVLEIIDDNGVIKACCCGLFSDQDKPEDLPPVYQFPLGGANNFSSMHVNDEIWLLFFDDNPLELYYIRKDIISETLKDILSNHYEEVEVLASREMPTGMVQIYYTNGDGWIIRNIDSVIQIRKDGSILLDSGSAHRKIDICDNSISLGSEGGSEHTGAYGDKVVESLDILYKMLNSISLCASANPYTAPIGISITKYLTQFASSIDKIESPHITLD